MKLKITRKIAFCFLTIVLSLAISSCSDTQNIKPKVKNKTINPITIEFGTQTTTENGITITKIDESTLKKYTKSVSDLFSIGSKMPSLFIASIYDDAKIIFDPPKNATNEKIFINLNILKSENTNDSLAVAHIKQTKKESGVIVERSGIIYMNFDGVVTGYKLNLFTDPSTSPEIPKATI